ncbi:serine hydrolase domain-containing protein [Streptomyces mirabilis]|uniref:serine hydrolase domain-containing protein n=1 Tax=Streptomyces mirabilis TaxID=68239 RepID=UPI0031BB8F4F
MDPAALQAALRVRPDDHAAGAIALVAEPGQVWRGSSGDTVTGKRIPDNSHFHIGSISKTFESTVVLQLAAEGRIDLNRPIQHYLPGLLPDTFQPITVRQLLNFTSGLPDVLEGAPPQSADERSPIGTTTRRSIRSSRKPCGLPTVRGRDRGSRPVRNRSTTPSVSGSPGS